MANKICLLCESPMRTVIDEDTGKQYYSCSNNNCDDYSEHYIRNNYPTANKVKSIHETPLNRFLGV